VAYGKGKQTKHRDKANQGRKQAARGGQDAARRGLRQLMVARIWNVAVTPSGRFPIVAETVVPDRVGCVVVTADAASVPV
jgi:hypothetical protein